MTKPPDEIRRTVDKISASYAAEWSATSRAHFDAGDYDWMSGFLHRHKVLLEIGTGDGTGTLSLARHAHPVVSLDLNPFCLDLAEEKLRSAKINVHRQTRQTKFYTRGNEYGINYGLISPLPIPRPPVLLVETDILADLHLPQLLSRIGTLDGVVLWCVGAHGCCSGITLEDARHYRVQVRGRAFQLADQFLRIGGVMNYVERMPALNDYADHIQLHRRELPSLLTMTTLAISDVQVRETNAVKAATGVRVSHAPIAGQREGIYALSSITLTKR